MGRNHTDAELRADLDRLTAAERLGETARLSRLVTSVAASARPPA